MSKENNLLEPLWKTMDPKEIDKQYSPSKWSKRYSSSEVQKVHVEVTRKLSEYVRKKIPNTPNINYGSKERTKLDVFGEGLPDDSYILVYVHGGYWQELEKDISLYPVEPLYNKGIVTIIVGYTLAPQASLAKIVDEIREAVKWCCRFAKKRKSKGLILMGWSAGGHLITEALATLTNTGGIETDYLKAFITLSGVFDVRPIVQIDVNDPLSLDEESAWSLSPLSNVDVLAANFKSIKAYIAVGENDSPEFRRQSKQYCHALKSNNIDAAYEEVKDVDHFNLVEELAKEDYDLTVKIINFINSLNPIKDTINSPNRNKDIINSLNPNKDIINSLNTNKDIINNLNPNKDIIKTLNPNKDINV